MRDIEYVPEPNDLQCGQAVLAMLTGLSVQEVCEALGNERETTLKEMVFFLETHGYHVSQIRTPVQDKEELPLYCLLSLETPRCWHWSLYANGIFFDPEHGVMDDFPTSNRRYYWAVAEKEMS